MVGGACWHVGAEMLSRNQGSKPGQHEGRQGSWVLGAGERKAAVSRVDIPWVPPKIGVTCLRAG